MRKFLLASICSAVCTLGHADEGTPLSWLDNILRMSASRTISGHDGRALYLNMQNQLLILGESFVELTAEEELEVRQALQAIEAPSLLHLYLTDPYFDDHSRPDAIEKLQVVLNDYLNGPEPVSVLKGDAGNVLFVDRTAAVAVCVLWSALSKMDFRGSYLGWPFRNLCAPVLTDTPFPIVTDWFNL